MTHSNFICFFFILLLSCKHEKTRISLKGEYAEGDIKIGKDTTYEGEIKYYDSLSNKLTSKRIYEDNLLNGDRVEYHPNGRIAAMLSYLDDNENGLSSFFDSTGLLLQTDNYFHGLRVGPHIKYSGNFPKTYSFYTFDGIRLFYLDYDSITGNTFSKNQLLYFTKTYVITNDKPNEVNNQFFIYIMNPPDFNFEYSFCVVNQARDITKTIRTFDKTKNWEVFDISQSEKKANQSFAFKLEVRKEEKVLLDTLQIVE